LIQKVSLRSYNETISGTHFFDIIGLITCVNVEYMLKGAQFSSKGTKWIL